MQQMIFKRLIITVLPLVVGSMLYAQAGFRTTDSGLEYAFHRQNKEAPRPLVGDFLYIHIVYNINGDTVFFDSRVNVQPMQIELRDPSYPGDLNEALSMMHQGDSATFIIDAGDFFLKTVQVAELPPPFKAGDKIHFGIVLEDIKSREDYLAEQQKQYAEREKQKEEARMKEKAEIDAYIAANNLVVRELAGGVRMVTLTEGTGAKAEPGKTVSVHYTGKFLNGDVFDSSVQRGEPIRFRLGANQVIKGWEVGIPELKTGGKAQLIIPFEMGYGERPAGTIPPFSTLLFEVELMDVIE